MSGTISIDAASFESVGTLGTTLNVGALNATLLNYSSAGYSIVLDFNPGTINVTDPIDLPSNTDVYGDDTVMDYNNINTPNWGNWGIFENTDFNSGGYSLNSIISVQGMTFVPSENENVFGVFIQNATSIDIQNDVFVEGMDGVALVDVQNAVDANDIAVGQVNASYDNWNGTENTLIEDNIADVSGSIQGYGSGASAGYFTASYGVLINAYTGNAANTDGNTQNDAVLNNLISSVWSGSMAVWVVSLEQPNSEANITEQGNVDTQMNTSNVWGFYTYGPAVGMTIQDNLVSGVNSGAATLYKVIGADNFPNPNEAPTANAVDTTVDGNLVAGASSSSGQDAIQNDGVNPTTTNNAVLQDTSSSQATTNSQAVSATGSVAAGTATVGGNTEEVTGSTLVGSPVDIGMTIAAPANLDIDVGSFATFSGLVIDDTTTIANPTINLTLSSDFGTLEFGSPLSADVTITTSGQTIEITGALNAVNTALASLEYESNAAGWDDALEISGVDTSGDAAVRYVPILVSTSYTSGLDNAPITIVPGFYVENVDSLATAIATAPAPLTLGLDTVIAGSGTNVIQTGTTTSTVLLGSGSTTVYGGVGQQYIATGSGNATITLNGGGSASVAGGTGGLSVDAASGNNLIEPGAGSGTFSLGSGSNSILGGLGSVAVTGGSGQVLIDTLPESGGNLTATLGSGGGIVYALSGNNLVATNLAGADTIYAGTGNDCIRSAGRDLIFTGYGSATVDASAGGSDTILGGAGNLEYLGGSGAASIVAPTGALDVTAGTGDLAIDIGQASDVNIVYQALTSTQRATTITGNFSGLELQLVGFVDQAISEAFSPNHSTLTLTLADGTQIDLAGVPSNLVAVDDNGTVELESYSGTLSGGFDVVQSGSAAVLTIGSTQSAALTNDPNENFGAIDNSGSLNLDDNVSIDIASVSNTGTLDLIQTTGTIGAVGNDGYMHIDPSSITVGDVVGTGVITIAAASTLDVTGSIASTQLLEFSGEDAVLEVGSAGSVGAITDLVNGMALGVVGTAGNQSILLAANSDGTFAGAGGMITASGASADIEAADGAWTICGASAGGDTLSATGESAFIQTAGQSQNIVDVSATNATVMAGGMNDLVVANAQGGQESDVVSVTGSASVYFLGGNATVAACAGSSGTAVMSSRSALGNIDFINQATTSATVCGGAANSVSVFGGAGGGYYMGGGAGDNMLVGGAGNTTLLGSGSNNFLSVSGGTRDLLYGGSGDDTLAVGAGATNAIMVTGSGSETLTSSGIGNTVFIVNGAGSATMTGSMAAGATNTYNLIEFSMVPHADVITNFRVGVDHLTIGSGLGGQVTISSVTSAPGGGSYVHLSDNTVIQFLGISISSSVVGSAQI